MLSAPHGAKVAHNVHFTLKSGRDQRCLFTARVSQKLPSGYGAMFVVSVSEMVHRSVVGKLGLDFEDLGGQRVKNITKAVRSFAWRQLRCIIARKHKMREQKLTPILKYCIYSNRGVHEEKLNMKVFAVTLAASVLALAQAAHAAGDLSRVDPTEIVIEMGETDAKHMYFKPNHFELETGKAYKIVLKNVGKIKHEFESTELAERVFTRKVEVVSADDKMIAEIKGSIREVELAPGGVAEWFIVPIQSANDIEMECALPGHKEAGMHGTITIK